MNASQPLVWIRVISVDRRQGYAFPIFGCSPRPITCGSPDSPITRSCSTLPPPIPIPDWRRFGRGNPKASQPGPVHARFSRGWAEIGVCFSDQASIGVGFADLLRVLLWLKVPCFSDPRRFRRSRTPPPWLQLGFQSTYKPQPKSSHFGVDFSVHTSFGVGFAGLGTG